MISPSTWVSSTCKAAYQQIIDRPKTVGVTVIALGGAVAAISSMYSLAAAVAVIAATVFACIGVAYLSQRADWNDAQKHVQTLLELNGIDGMADSDIEPLVRELIQVNPQNRESIVAKVGVPDNSQLHNISEIARVIKKSLKLHREDLAKQSV